MKVKKVFKKIAALGIGATMVGATLFGASAATLADYPEVMVKEGQWNALFVVGQEADAIDTIGMTNVALGAQKAAVSTTTVCSGTTSSTVSSVSDGVKIETSGSKYNVDKDLNDVNSNALDASDLPNILAEEVFKDSEGDNEDEVDYDQEIELGDSGIYGFFFDDDYVDEAGPYLFFEDGVAMYTYTLEFDSSVEYDTADVTDDLKSNTITIQGMEYTITDTDDNAGTLSELTLMAGKTVKWMTQGETITKDLDDVEHTITMIDVGGDSTKCGFDVDGTTIWIDVDETETVNGVTLGVTDAVEVNNEKSDADICKVNIGATELTLTDGDNVDREGEVEDAVVTFNNAAAGDWDGFEITYTPTDDVYLAPGEELVDPVFGNFKFVFGGEIATRETIEASTSSNDGMLTFMNSDGDDIEIPLYYDDTGATLYLGTGEDADEQYYLSADTCAGTASVEDCDGSHWLLMDGDNELHVVEITDLDATEQEVSFEDLTTGNTDTDVDYSNGTITISGFSGTFDFDVTGNDLTITGNAVYGADATQTSYEHFLTDIDRTSVANQFDFTFTESGEGDFDAVASDILFRFTVNSDDEIEVEVSADQLQADNLDASTSDDDTKVDLTDFGSILTWDSDNKDMATAEVPEEAAVANVFVAPTGANIQEGASGDGCVTTEKQNPIPSTANKFDTEVADWTAQNVVSIGGPCANSVSAHIFGDPEVCYEGFEAGKAILKMVENGDNVAIAVAGGTGEDTKLLSMILQDYEDYEFSGMDMVATTVSASNLQIEAVEEVAMEEEEESSEE